MLFSLVFVFLWCVKELQCESMPVYSNIMWQSAIEVYDYKSFRSSYVLEYTVKEKAVNSTWIFETAIEKSSKKCPQRPVVVFLQHDSYPLVTPLNETFPKYFNTHHAHLYKIVVHNTSSPATLMISNPLPGSWYFVTYFADYVDEKIQQQGLTRECKYLIGGRHMTEVLDTTEPLQTDTEITLAVSNTTSYFSFYVPEYTWQFVVTVTCKSDDTSSVCPVALSTRGLALPDWNSSHSQQLNCTQTSSNSTPCQLTVLSPPVNSLHYMIIKADGPDLSLLLNIELFACLPNSTIPKAMAAIVNHTAFSLTLNSTNQTLEDLNITHALYSKDDLPVQNTRHHHVGLHRTPSTSNSLGSNTDVKVNNIYHYDEFSNGNISGCFWLEELARYDIVTRTFDVSFLPHIGGEMRSGKLHVPETFPLLMKFHMEPHIDIGGTLSYTLKMVKDFLTNEQQKVEIQSCIQPLSLPVSSLGVACHHDNLLVVANHGPEGSDRAEINFPYPPPGYWYISMIAVCYNCSAGSTCRVVACDQYAVIADMTVESKPCVAGGCGTYGSCQIDRYQTVVVSACSCIADYRGYGCTDDSVALTESEQLSQILFLSLSNLCFLPAAVLAFYRCKVVEGFMYLFVGFFSGVYHACDTKNRYTYCILPFTVLGVADFFGSVMAIVATLTAMARLPQYGRHILHVLSAQFLVIAVTYNRTAMWVFLIPTVSLMVVMFATWSYQCHHKHQCYPPAKYWLTNILPGCLLAATGFICFAFFETESNYWYIHSTWHMCIAFCIVFLLPPKQDQDGSCSSKYCKYCVCKTSTLDSVEPLHVEDNDSSSNSFSIHDAGSVENIDEAAGIYSKTESNNDYSVQNTDASCKL